MKKPNKKTLVLTIVAFVLVLMSLVSFTFSWIDDIKLVEFQNDDLAKNGAPLKTGTDINASVTINKTDNTIDLGNMLQTGDISFQYNNGNPQQYSEEDATSPTAATQHIKYDTDPTNPIKNPNRDDINEKKGYFYESGGMHLSPCYSDGETFYFSKGNNTYREGNKDDENVNYISFTTKVSSPDANVSFWFEDVPKIYEHGTQNEITKARYAITVDGKSHMYSGETSGGNVVAKTITNNQITDVPGARKTSDFTIRSADNITTNANSTNYTTSGGVEKNANANTLFSIKKGDTVNLNIKIWLEEGVAADVEASDISLSLVSSWKYTRTITITDKTTANGASSWIGNNGARLYFTLPSVLSQLQSNPSLWDSGTYQSSNAFFELTRSGDSYTISGIPFIYNNEEMVLYRCNAQGWYNSGSDAVKRSKYDVHCWNWWQTNLPNSFCNETYTLYGSSLDKTAHDNFDDITATNKGYGTWGGVVQIHFDGKTKSVGVDGSKLKYGSGSDLATNNGKMFVVDYSDHSVTNEVYIYEMYYNNNVWNTYIPASSCLIQFKGVWSSSKAYWGYKSWTGNNPQMRPTNKYTYYATQLVGNEGVGFWEDNDVIYLIANGGDGNNGMVGKTPYDKIDTSSVKNDASAGRSAMTEVTGVTYQGVYKVYKTSKTGDDSSSCNTVGHYYHVIFDNGTQGGVHESSQKVLFPGCYFDWENDCWIGSLTGNERGSGDDNSGGSGDDEGGGVTTPILDSEPTEDGVYLYGKLDGAGSESQYAKFDLSSAGGKAYLRFVQGRNYSIKIFKKSGNTKTYYANNQYDSQNPSIGDIVSTWYFSQSYIQKVAFFPSADGYIEFEIKSINSNDVGLDWEYKSSLL